MGRPRCFTVLVLIVASLGSGAGPAAAGPPPDADVVVCPTANEPFPPNESHSLGCVWYDDDIGDYPDAGVCVTDGAVGVLLWWYPPTDLACAYTRGEYRPMLFGSEELLDDEYPEVCAGPVFNPDAACVNTAPSPYDWCLVWLFPPHGSGVCDDPDN